MYLLKLKLTLFYRQPKVKNVPQVPNISYKDLVLDEHS